jgi:hypothetical protein
VRRSPIVEGASGTSRPFVCGLTGMARTALILLTFWVQKSKMQQKEGMQIDEGSQKEKLAGKPFREIVKYYIRAFTVGQIASQLGETLDTMEETPRRIAEWAALGFATLAKEKAFWKRDWVEVAAEIRATASTYFRRLGTVPTEETLLDIVQVVVLSLAYAEKSNKSLDKSLIIRKIG